MKNRDGKCRYLIVDAKNVIKYPIELLDSFNNEKEIVNLDETFEEHNVPQKYRYLIIRINPLMSKTDFQEYLEEIPFQYEKDKNVKVIRGYSIAGDNIIEFKTSSSEVSYEEAVMMYIDLANDGLFDEYRNVLVHLFKETPSLYKNKSNIKTRKRNK